MANLPAESNQSSKPTAYERTIRKLVKRGWTSGQIANKLAPHDPRKRKMIRSKVRAIIAKDPDLQALNGLAGVGVIHENVEAISEALVRRALRGRVDAIKLALEYSGHHNPRVKHDHTGDIKITVDIPRPALPKPVEGSAEEVTDAEVVED